MKNLKEILKKLNNWKHILVLVVIVSGIFYWFQLRPTLIKRQCSWVTYTTQTPAIPAVPAFAGITKIEAEQQFKVMQRDYKGPSCSNITNTLNKFVCESFQGAPPDSFETLEQPPRPAVAAIPAGPEIKNVRNASNVEYNACLRHNGL